MAARRARFRSWLHAPTAITGERFRTFAFVRVVRFDDTELHKYGFRISVWRAGELVILYRQESHSTTEKSIRFGIVYVHT